MKKLIHQHTISFRHAAEGILWAFRTQPNFRIHFFLTFCALALGYALQISRTEWLLLLFIVLLGLVTEMLNTCVESMTDLITTEWHEQAKIAKDVAAGMMLLVACGAIIVAICIFGPRLYTVFSIV